MRSALPDIVAQHLPSGYEPSPGVKLVLPSEGEHSIESVNTWIRTEDWYPDSLGSIVWFGDDGVGNLLGWKPDTSQAVLWNPEDGDALQRECSVKELWEFILNGYRDAT
jgi:hypothetical protein